MDRNPSTPSRSSAFRVGRNSRGNWVAQDIDGLRGGLFVSRAEAVRFALLANIHHPQDITMVPGALELDMGAGADPSPGGLAAKFGTIAHSVVALRRLTPDSNRKTDAASDLGAGEHRQAPRKVANGR